MILFKTIYIFFFAFIFCSVSGFAQSNENEALINYLENAKTITNKFIGSPALENISNAKIIQCDFQFNLDNNSWGGNTISFYFLKSGNTLKPFKTIYQLAESNEFIAALNDNFKLQTEEEALAFQTLLNTFDFCEYNQGFFQNDKTWFFVRKSMFDESEVFKVNINDNFKVISVEYSSGMKLELPETMLKAGEKLKFAKTEPEIVSKSDSLFTNKYVYDNLNYKYSAKKIITNNTAKITDAEFYNAELTFTEKDGYGESTTIFSASVLYFDGKFERSNNTETLILNDIFLKSIKKDFKLKTKADAKSLELFFDEICPVSESDFKQKKFYQKDGLWFFVRESGSEEKEGFVIRTDKQNKILMIDYIGINKSNILRFRMKDPAFKVDYGFKLVEPAKNNLTISQGKDLSVKMKFNADFANAKGTWILSRFDGKMVGMRAGTTIESPYKDEIPSEVLTLGKHVMEYLLLPNGKNTDNPLGIITINIEVK